MNSEALKRNMMKLWKYTFHDSDDYVNLIFNNYFNEKYIEYFEEDGKLISALLGIPYDFYKGKNHIKGLYLCGLATLPEFRGRGIMGHLIESINKKAFSEGYSFTFLIPASDILGIYYYQKKYMNAIYRVEERYTSIHNFNNDYFSTLEEDVNTKKLKIDLYKKYSVDEIEEYNENNIKEIIKYIDCKEQDNSHILCLKHNEKDIEILLRENKISRGRTLVCRSENGEVKGVLLMHLSSDRRIIIPKIYSDDKGSCYRMLQKAKELYPENSMSVYRFPEEVGRKVLWSEIYGASNPDGTGSGAFGMAERVYDVSRHAIPYGMVRILDFCEILKFVAEDRPDSKFSILVKDVPEDNKFLKCVVSKSKAEFADLTKEEADLITDKEVMKLSRKDLCEMLLRRKDSNGIIMEAIGIPRLGMDMALMLD